MLHVSAPTSNQPAYASRKDAAPHSATNVLDMLSSNRPREASAVLIVPIIDERHHGADLLMIPISDDNKRFAKPQKQSSPSTARPSSRTETPAAPTPPPKPQLPQGCDDWDSYLSQKKSNATLPSYENEGDWINPAARIQSPELNFKHSFEQLGWRDCLNQAQRQKANARALCHRPSGVTLAPTVYDANSPADNNNNSSSSSSAVSLRSAKRLSNASTLTTNTAATAPFLLPSTAYKRLSSSSALTTHTAPCILGSASSLRSAKRLSAASTLTANTVATVPCYLGSASSSSYPTAAAHHKRLSNASTLTTSTFTSIASSSSSLNGKPRSLRRINRARHLRAYYSDGALLRARRLSVGISSMQGIAERREPELLLRAAAAAVAGKRGSAASMPLVQLRGELGAPPPYPPPEKPLPSLPVMEVRELQTGERARWRELLLRSFPRREGSRRRAGGVTVR